MKGISISRLKRAAMLIGVTALTVGGVVVGSGQAHAAAPLGNTPGLVLNPASGSTTGTIGYSAPACPSGFQGSGIVRIVDPATSATSNLSAVNGSVAAAWSGNLTANILNTEATGVFTDLVNNTAEIVTLCASGASLGGSTEYVYHTFITFDATGANYTASTGPAQSVTVALAANPNPATVGQSVTLTATLTPSSATGSVQFQNNGTNINTAVTVSGGVASTSFTPSATSAGLALTAVYTPGTGFTSAGNGTLTLPVVAAAPNSGQIPLAVIVPQSGVFTVTIDTTDWVVLNVNLAGTQASNNTTPIVVVDTRNFYPGWSVSGQSTQFTGTIPASPAGFPATTFAVPADHGSQHMPADNLGWTPTNATALPQGLTLGPAVAPGTTTNGLGDAAQLLASVHAGTGNGFTGTTGVTLGASLLLNIPAGQEAGPYAGFLNITSVNALP
jgi:hypothetical protein